MVNKMQDSEIEAITRYRIKGCDLEYPTREAAEMEVATQKLAAWLGSHVQGESNREFACSLLRYRNELAGLLGLPSGDDPAKVQPGEMLVLKRALTGEYSETRITDPKHQAEIFATFRPAP